MTVSGSGTGTPVVVTANSDSVYDQMRELSSYPNCAISLPRYAKLIGYEEASFWGVVFENQMLRGCDPLWTEFERQRIAMSLAEAQQEIEQIIGYPLCPTWIVGTLAEEARSDNRWVDQQKYRAKMMTRYPRIIQLGSRVVDNIGNSVAVTHNSTVGVIGPIATAATEASEIHVYYEDSDREIFPSKITLSGGYVTIEVPRYRMVVQSLINTPEGGVEYDVLSNFLSHVDVRRIYNDPSDNAILAKPNCSSNLCEGSCQECTTTACVYVRDSETGIIDLRPANWDSTSSEWKISNEFCSPVYEIARLYYQSGMRFLNYQAEQAIIRLAHSKMGTPPCSCSKVMDMWKDDHEIPTFLTRQRLNCPFGLSNGAWIAYKWALSLASVRASIL